MRMTVAGGWVPAALLAGAEDGASGGLAQREVFVVTQAQGGFVTDVVALGLCQGGEPGCRTAGVATCSSDGSAGASWKRAVWYLSATLPEVVQQGEPAGA
ncbi:hypothetical protein [Streptomyces sp. KHY 26]|uniref:hypothetical protein n=1 Tax=Streptomyces sp. KHY 26 TaxID=3097359 RepID=UPI00376EAA5B